MDGKIKALEISQTNEEGINWTAMSARVEAMERQEAAETIRRNLKESGAFEDDLKNAGWENFIKINNNQSQLTARRICEEYTQKILAGKTSATLLFYGPSSTGKTYYALSVLKKFCNSQKPPLKFQKQDGTWEDANIKQWHRGYYITSEAACRILTDNTWEDKAERKHKAQKLMKAEFLIIDELGRSLQTQKKERDSLFEILNFRISTRRPTFLISNFLEQELADFFGSALFNRINAAAVLFDASKLPNMRDPQVQDQLKVRRERNGRTAMPSL